MLAFLTFVGLGLVVEPSVRAQDHERQWNRSDYSTDGSLASSVNPLSTMSPPPFTIGAYPTPAVPAPGADKGSPLVDLNILTNTGARNRTAPLLYGWMFEDIDV